MFLVLRAFVNYLSVELKIHIFFFSGHLAVRTHNTAGITDIGSLDLHYLRKDGKLLPIKRAQGSSYPKKSGRRLQDIF
jgi:hypothetical protein